MADATTPDPVVIDVSERDFAVRVLEESKKRPVIVDFWAPWCGPCRTLGPVLEAEAQAAGGSFLLVKVNTDENPNLSQQMGIRGIPAVKAFVDGRLADEFTGALPKRAVQEFLQRLKKGPEAALAREAVELAEQGDLDGADQKAADALALVPDLALALVVRAQAAAARGDVDAAEGFLARADGDPALRETVAQLRARMLIVKTVQTAGDEPALRQRLEAGDDKEAALGVAAYDLLAGREDAAFARLLPIVTSGGEAKGRAHQMALALIALADEDRGRALRKKLSMALF